MKLNIFHSLSYFRSSNPSSSDNLTIRFFDTRFCRVVMSIVNRNVAKLMKKNVPNEICFTYVHQFQ